MSLITKRNILLSTAFVILTFSCIFYGIGPSSGESNNTINISGQISDLQNKYVLESIITLCNPANEYNLTTNLSQSGTFRFDNISLDKGKGNLMLQVESLGYVPWEKNFSAKPGATLDFYITLVPIQNNLISILLGPALIGLSCWLAILISRRYGKIFASLLIAIYLGPLLHWMAVTEGWISSSSLRSFTTRGVSTSVMGYSLPSVPIVLLIVIALIIVIGAIMLLRKGASQNGAEKELSKGDLIRSNATWFVGSAIVLWAFTLAGLIYGYHSYGAFSVIIFEPDLSAPFIVLAFAFIGILVYAAANIRENSEFSIGSLVFRKKLMVLGERILVGPYIALVAYFILFRPVLDQIKLLSEGIGALSAMAFFAFFTGLYVKPVMDRLDQIGTSLLTKEGQKKIELREKEKDEFVDFLGLSNTFAQVLRGINISSIDDLSRLSMNEIENKVKDSRYLSARKLQGAHEMGVFHIKDTNCMRDILKLNSEQLDELSQNQITSIGQLSILSKNEISNSVEIGDASEVERIKVLADAISELSKKIKEIPSNGGKLIDEDVVEKLEQNGIKIFGDMDVQDDSKIPKDDRLVKAYRGLPISPSNFKESLKGVRIKDVVKYLSY